MKSVFLDDHEFLIPLGKTPSTARPSIGTPTLPVEDPRARSAVSGP
jgi:hypothetical protein